MENSRFKFRAWNKKTQKMKKVMALISEEGVYYSLRVKENEAVVTPCEQPHMVLMQCTGLKDKNGKLIYEGDIVKENWHTYVIDHDRGYSINDIKTKCSYTISTLCSEKSEVIGNIYENPELLEVK